MNPKVLVFAVAALLAVAAVFLVLMRKRKATTADLRQRFGPEYDRAVTEHGSQRRAEAQLGAREKRVGKLEIRALDPAERERFIGEWQSMQSRFVDDPKRAIGEADALVSSLMQARGYPVADFSQRAADISVDYPSVVANYRAAHEIRLRHEKGEASTEDLRRAMIHYRSLFEEVVRVPVALAVQEVA
jgi:hypothetical protein